MGIFSLIHYKQPLIYPVLMQHLTESKSSVRVLVVSVSIVMAVIKSRLDMVAWLHPWSSNLTWITRSLTGTPQVIAVSSDGHQLLISNTDNTIYTSSNSGFSWTLQTTLSFFFVSIANSYNGQNLIGGTSSGYLYLSNNDGSTWTPQLSLPSGNWTGVASSSNGSTVMGCLQGGTVHISNNAGSTWSSSGTPQTWTGIATSSDGSIIAVVGTGIPIYLSVNNGATWNTYGSSHSWTCIAMSYDGTYMVAGTNDPDYVYFSNNGGTIWSPLNPKGSPAQWKSVAISSDGSTVVAVESSGSYYLSKNSGGTWFAQGSLGTQTWNQVAMSLDGTNLYGLASQVYLSTLNPTLTAYQTGSFVCNSGSTLEVIYENSGQQWIVMENQNCTTL